MTVLRTSWDQVRHRRGRASALAAGILIPAVSFSLLTSAATTNTARISGTVDNALQPAYDILVRPSGSAAPLEQAKGLVRSNYLSGSFGGISQQQYDRIRSISGVGVAAPIAMVGYILQAVNVAVDATPALTADDSQVMTLTSTRTADRGSTVFPARNEGYVYVTGNPLRPPPQTGGRVDADAVVGPTETLPDGRESMVCPNASRQTVTSPFTAIPSGSGYCWSRRSGLYGAGGGLSGLPDGHVGGRVRVVFPFLLAAIDPEAERRLVGLDATVTQGRYLQATDGVAFSQDQAHHPVVPVLAATAPFVDDQDTVTVNRLPAAAVSLMRQGLSPDELAARLAALPATPAHQVTITAQAPYDQLLRGLSEGSTTFVDAFWTAGSTTYESTGQGRVAPNPVSNPDSVWRSNFSSTGYKSVPIDATDLSFRELHEQLGDSTGNQLWLPTLRSVGRFDPTRLPGFNALSQVPLETYYPPVAVGADQASRAVLGERPLLPDANPAGYLQPPPLILTTLAALPAFQRGFPTTRAEAPISAIRIKVTDLGGSARQRLDRIAQIATAIRTATGLEVDVTAGSSPTQLTVALPAGKYGRAALSLAEPWVRKGVALVVLREVDRKSVVLFALILLVAVFFLTNGTFAAVRGRRREIGVLRCLGWSRRAIVTMILGELVLIGLVAGLAGTGVSVALVAMLGLGLPLWRVLLVTPVAVALAVLAGLLPAWLAGRGQPLDAVAPAVVAFRRARPVRGLPGLAWVNLRRRPGRAALAAAALAVGVAGLTVLFAVNAAFVDGVAGSRLGEFVATQARGVDYLSVALAIGLGAASVGDVLYLNLRERAAELAILAAAGWRRSQLIRVSLYEASGIGIIGGLAGAVAGLVVTAMIGGDVGAVLVAAVVAAVLGVAVCLLAAAVVAGSIIRAPVAAVLAEE